MSSVLVISVHPDDETLGCGGAILRHRSIGDDVHWLIITEPRPSRWEEAVIEAKRKEVEAVSDAYEMSSVQRVRLPATCLDQLPVNDIIEGVRSSIETVCPNVVYMVHGGDIHTDHYYAFTATMSVLKTFYMNRFGVERLLCYETLSSTEAAPQLGHRMFAPNAFLDISSFLKRKVEIMSLYSSESQPDPLPRGPSSIEALARHRGASIGVEYAEAFMLLREVR